VVWRVRATDAENDTLQYRFLIKGPDTEGIWKDVTGWIEDDSWSWKTSEEDFGKNEVQVQVRDGKHASLGKEDLSRIEEFRINSLNSPPDIKSLDPESKSPQPAGSTVVFKAQAIDQDGDEVSYKFWLKGPSTDGEWLEKTGWIKGGRWSWHTTGSDIGQSQIKVWIRDGKHEGC
jgi:large repetitive protein